MEEGRKKENYLSFGDGKYLYMSDYNQVINAGLKDMFLEHAADRIIETHDDEVNEDLLKEKIQDLPQLIFEITENCNLRCKYCVFGGNYENERELSSLNLSFDTAKKAIDYLFSIIKNREKKELFFSYYGGEPLLNFKTIKKIVAYTKENFPDWKFRNNMTTNLTMMDIESLDFLIENNFSILVSLDGNRDNHDAKRVFADGSGSHNTVMKNLEKIRTHNQEYFDNKVRFSAVYSYDLPLKNLYNFFSSEDSIKQQFTRLSPVNAFNTSYYDEYPFDKKESRKSFADMYARILEKVRLEEELSGIESFLFNNLKEMNDALKGRDDTPLAGSCLFNQRLYLDARGRFHMCERLNNTFSFGDVDKGFDFEKMVRIVNEFKKVVKTHCSDCNIKLLCTRCYLQFAGNGQFKLDPEFCENQKKAIPNKLERYIKCKEEKML